MPVPVWRTTRAPVAMSATSTAPPVGGAAATHRSRRCRLCRTSRRRTNGASRRPQRTPPPGRRRSRARGVRRRRRRTRRFHRPDARARRSARRSWRPQAGGRAPARRHAARPRLNDLLQDVVALLAERLRVAKRRHRLAGGRLHHLEAAAADERDGSVRAEKSTSPSPGGARRRSFATSPPTATSRRSCRAWAARWCAPRAGAPLAQPPDGGAVQLAGGGDAPAEGARRRDRRSVAADGRPLDVARLWRPCGGHQRRDAATVDGPDAGAPGRSGEHVLPVGGQERVEVGNAAVQPEARVERNARGGSRDHDLPVPGHRCEHASPRCEASAFAQPVATVPTCLRAATSQTRTLPSAFASATGAVVAEGRAGRELAVHLCTLGSALRLPNPGMPRSACLSPGARRSRRRRGRRRPRAGVGAEDRRRPGADGLPGRPPHSTGSPLSVADRRDKPAVGLIAAVSTTGSRASRRPEAESQTRARVSVRTS